MLNPLPPQTCDSITPVSLSSVGQSMDRKEARCRKGPSVFAKEATEGHLFLFVSQSYLPAIPRMPTLVSRRSACYVSNQGNFPIPSSKACNEVVGR